MYSPECLKTLHVNNTRYSNVTTHHKDTFEWLWTSPEYVAWSCAERSSLLLIDGKPGSGKSTLVRYFKDHHGSQSYTVGEHAIVSDFFYSRRDGESERSHCNMLRSLLYDILAADESFFIHFQEQFRHLSGEVNGSWPYGTLKSILLACGRHPLKRTLVFIVDAIDESDETDRWDATSFLLQLSTPVSTNCVVKVFLASRPINELQQDPTVTCNCIRLQERNKEDIYKYTDAFLGDQVFCHAQGFKKQAQEYIVQHADGVFLWVSLIRKALVRYASNGRSIAQLMTYLKGLPMEIASYYVLMLEALESGDPDDIRDGRRVLQFCLFSHRAVKLIELDHALAIPGHSLDTGLDTASWEARRPIDIRKRVTHCAGNFVEIRSRRLLGADGKSPVFFDFSV